MYGLPVTYDVTIWKDKVLESLCFFPYHITLFFSDDLWLGIESGWTLFEKGNVIEDISSFPIQRSELLRLLDCKISFVTFDWQKGNIQFNFENGYALFVNGDIGPYEAYRIFNGKKEIIV